MSRNAISIYTPPKKALRRRWNTKQSRTKAEKDSVTLAFREWWRSTVESGRFFKAYTPIEAEDYIGPGDWPQYVSIAGFRREFVAATQVGCTQIEVQMLLLNLLGTEKQTHRTYNVYASAAVPSRNTPCSYKRRVFYDVSGYIDRTSGA